MGDALVLFLLLIVVFFSLRSLYKTRKRGGCCGSCEGCTRGCKMARAQETEKSE